MSDLSVPIRRLADAIVERTGESHHDVAVVLGSGFGTYATTIDGTAVSYADLPGIPAPAAVGHAGRLVSTRIGPSRVLLFSGRVHAYEGHPMESVVLAIRAAIVGGCRTVVLTNAAGGCGAGMKPGDLVLITDHINLAGRNPLVGPNDDRLGPRFPDMTNVYSPRLRALAHEVATAGGQTLGEGIYAWFLGPTFETPAEVEMARRLGADLVGMSTVPEAIAARHLGAEILGISLVTNLAAGISPNPISSEEVMVAAAEAAGRFTELFDALLPKL